MDLKAKLAHKKWMEERTRELKQKNEALAKEASDLEKDLKDFEEIEKQYHESSRENERLNALLGSTPPQLVTSEKETEEILNSIDESLRTGRGERWTKEDCEKVLYIYNAKRLYLKGDMLYTKVAEHFPERTMFAVRDKIRKLLEKKK